MIYNLSLKILIWLEFIENCLQHIVKMASLLFTLLLRLGNLQRDRIEENEKASCCLSAAVAAPRLYMESWVDNLGCQ